MLDVNERENLEALVASDGWKTFAAYVGQEWGAGGRAFLDATTKAADQKADADAMAYLRQIIVAQREIQKLVKWPEERLKQLEPIEYATASRDYSRRGSL